MITRLEITNYRRFARFSLRLGSGNVLAGPNNSGKSSILDAFRLLEACFRHSRTRGPELLRMDGQFFVDGYGVPDSVLPFSLANVALDYSDGNVPLSVETCLTAISQ